MPTLRTPHASQFFRPWFVATVLCFCYCIAVIDGNHGDAKALVTIGTQFSEGIPAEDGGTEGYDGQFVYFIARDPTHAESYLDVPAYRFQRILLPVLGRILAFGNQSLIPWSLLLINLIALAGGTALLEHWLRAQNVSRWYAIGYAFSMGVFGTVRLSLPEPLAYGLVLAGITLALNERWLMSAIIFALAALAKETTLLFAGGFMFYLLTRKQWRDLIGFGLITGIPFLVWQWILYDRLESFGVGSGGAKATSFEIIPFAGVIRILTEGGPVIFIIFLILLGPFVLLPTYWALRQGWQSVKRHNVDSLVILLIVNGLIMAFVPFSTYREPLGIFRFIVGLQIVVILFAARQHYQRALLYSTLWMWTLAFLIGSDMGSGSP